MKKVFQNHKEVAHIWAQQEHPEGRASRVFFTGQAIYSYGHHFCIARFVDSNVVLFTTRDYSPSTAKHKAIVQNAIPYSCQVFTVPSGVDDNSALNHEKNITYYIEKITEAVGKMERARTQAEAWYQIAIDLCKEATAYAKYFDIKPTQTLIDLNIDLGKISVEQLRETSRIWQTAKEKKALEDLNVWKVDLKKSASNSFFKLPVALRAYPPDANRPYGIIQTSHGASVPIEDGIALYNAILQGCDVKGFRVGHFTVNSFDGDVVTIGCHKIALDEARRVLNAPKISERYNVKEGVSCKK